MDSTPQTTPDFPSKNAEENSKELGEGLDAKGIVDSHANEVGEGRNLQVAKEMDEVDNTHLLRVTDAGTTVKAHYSCLYFSICGKEVFYALSDWMLHKLLKDHQSKCITLGFPDKNSQTHETSYPSPP
jgi:hypothetical protein